MSRQVLVVRGGALSRSTGLGRAHHDLVDRLGQDLVAGYSVANVIEHELGGNPLTRWRRRRKHHPSRVDAVVKENSADILHITDQEQAHLVPMDCKIPVSITVHDLFHLKPRKISTKQAVSYTHLTLPTKRIV